jgi:hypothetical protein
MRQRRQGLQVSTFPFLAVLLCAMGSLILLLLVIDRRAKFVARVKAMRAMELAVAATAEDEKAAAIHRAEWERRRQILHDQLLQEDQQVTSELQAVQAQAAGAAGKAEIELGRNRQLQEQLQAERTKLARLEDDLTAQRVEAVHAAGQAGAAGAELARLTADLERMERTMADLKAARQRQQQMYSLVPYRGKRGDNREPLYLECSRDELIFHPDRLALRGMTLTASMIRGQIERRLSQQRSETRAVNKKREENAYLLMLIRPNGIATYYQTLAALSGLHIDFGYEFIDQDWLLDFSENENMPKKQPWMTADGASEIQPPGSSGKAGVGKRSSESGNSKRPYAGLASGGNLLGRPVGFLASGSAGQGNAPFGNGGVGNSERGNFGALPSGNPGTTARPGAPGSGLVANASGVGNGPGFGSFGGPYRGTGNRPYLNGVGKPGIGTADQDGPALNGLVPPGSPAGDDDGPSLGPSVTARDGPFAGQEGSREGNLAVAPRNPPGQVEPPGRFSGASQEVENGHLVSDRQRGTSNVPSDLQSAQPGGTGQPQMEKSPEGSRKAGIDAPPNLMPPSPGDRERTSANPGSGTLPGPPRVSRDHGAPSQSETGENQPGRHVASDPLDQLRAQNAPRAPVRGLPARPGPLVVGNRDWIIPIECTADTLVVRPSGQRIATADLSNGNRAHNVLLETVQRMVTRRQATVRPGEPLYRPMIRFRVWPDGLRSYYLAYPALEALQVPMSRENLDPREETAGNQQR